MPVVGDSLRDLEAAEAAGAIPVLVKTGRGRLTQEKLSKGEQSHTLGQTPVYADLAAFTDAVLDGRLESVARHNGPEDAPLTRGDLENFVSFTVWLRSSLFFGGMVVSILVFWPVSMVAWVLPIVSKDAGHRRLGMVHQSMARYHLWAAL